MRVVVRLATDGSRVENEPALLKLEKLLGVISDLRERSHQEVFQPKEDSRTILHSQQCGT